LTTPARRTDPWRRRAFWAYAAFVFIGTHYPKLVVPGAGRPDILVHIAVFALWTALIIACGFFGPPLSARNLIVSAVIAAIYSGVDELLQAIPFIRRVPAWDDWGANLIGVASATGVAALLSFRSRRAAAEAGVMQT
jgi:hypothetical protein